MSLDTPPAPVVVWDRFVRCFHWALVLCVLGNQFVTDSGGLLHQVLGHLATALVVSRVVWGFVGTKHARFADFLPTPARLTAHLRSLRQPNAPLHPGHNPVGALMMLMLMALVLALGLTGWMQTLDAWWGNEPLQELHEWLARALLIAAGAHAAAALVMGRLERTTLLTAMFTGVKRRT